MQSWNKLVDYSVHTPIILTKGVKGLRYSADVRKIESLDGLERSEPYQPKEWEEAEHLLLPKDFVIDPDDDDDPPPSTPPPGASRSADLL